MKFANKIKLLAVILISLLFLIQTTSSLTLKKSEKSENDLSLEAERHKAKKSLRNRATAPSSSSPAPNVPANLTFNATNNTFVKSLYGDLNQTFTTLDVKTFKTDRRSWNDLKLFDKQLEDIYADLIYKQNTAVTPEAHRASIQIFANQFQACDTDSNQVLSLEEFYGCFAVNDTYLSRVAPPNARFATYINNSFTNMTGGFYEIIFNLMDTYSLGYLNFHDYMFIRLMVFSWRKCSVGGPFIEEVAFECAIEIAAGTKTLSRNTARHLYLLGLELSNAVGVRNLDFVAYFIVAQSARLFGKINNKEDQDSTKSEFNLALDNNALPSRYNQDVINQLFKIIHEAGKPNQGIDLLSFVFYDFALRLFEVPNAAKKWFINQAEFTKILSNWMFPSKLLAEIKLVAQNNLTAASYQMYTYLNISAYHQEADHFLKFAQTGEKVATAVERKGVNGFGISSSDKIPFSLPNTATWFFNILDNDNDGYLQFYDFANFMQIAYLFQKFDPYNKGKIVAGDLFEKFENYADFPYVGYIFRERAKRFNLFPQDQYMDLLRATLIMRIEDIINVNTRRVDPTTLYEIELKTIFANVNLGAVPDSYLNKCLRGVDDKDIPKYDWECAFIQGVTLALNYLESSSSYLTAKKANINLSKTTFVNIDPQIYQP
jgi:hypothetical protein